MNNVQNIGQYRVNCRRLCLFNPLNERLPLSKTTQNVWQDGAILSHNIVTSSVYIIIIIVIYFMYIIHVLLHNFMPSPAIRGNNMEVLGGVHDKCSI